MSVFFGNEESYKGAVLDVYSHMWMDGMEEEIAVVWNKDSHESKHITVGYYGADGSNLAGGHAVIDATEEIVRDVIKTLKTKAHAELPKFIAEYEREVRAGRKVKVVRGRKIPVGTILNVFWVGERETFRSRRCGWMNETETIAGCKTEAGEKVWVKAEYLEPVDGLTISEEEAESWLRSQVKSSAGRLNIKIM